MLDLVLLAIGFGSISLSLCNMVKTRESVGIVAIDPAEKLENAQLDLNSVKDLIRAVNESPLFTSAKRKRDTDPACNLDSEEERVFKVWRI